MKYMGSKRALLRNGLGELLVAEASNADRFVDLFSGSGQVSWHVAGNTDRTVLAVDLQTYSKILADAVLLRTQVDAPDALRASWLEKAKKSRSRSRLYRSIEAFGNPELTAVRVSAARETCQQRSCVGPTWSAYGGFYYSPRQALTFDYMLKHLPPESPSRQICLAATIWAASRCAASPGHTAQPFRPTEKALPFIQWAWSRDPIEVALDALGEILSRSAQVPGSAVVSDALDVAAELGPSDLVFVDPPYSNAQYSRYYHVLETMARGACGEVEGAGRYPQLTDRPQSAFSMKSKSETAFIDLVELLSAKGCRVILTFPEHKGSNGLRSDWILGVCRRHFHVDVVRSASEFSTLGGNGELRASRRRTGELILRMHPS